LISDTDARQGGKGRDEEIVSRCVIACCRSRFQPARIEFDFPHRRDKSREENHDSTATLDLSLIGELKSSIFRNYRIARVVPKTTNRYAFVAIAVKTLDLLCVNHNYIVWINTHVSHL